MNIAIGEAIKVGDAMIDFIRIHPHARTIDICVIAPKDIPIENLGTSYEYEPKEREGNA